jgi:hypothetical protein
MVYVSLLAFHRFFSEYGISYTSIFRYLQTMLTDDTYTGNNLPQQSSILVPMALHNREFPVHRNEAKVKKKKGAIGELSTIDNFNTR